MTRVAAALCVLVLAACTEEEPALPERAPLHAGDITPADLAGCYDVALDEWKPPIDGAQARLFSPPPRVRLTVELFPMPRTQRAGIPASYQMFDGDAQSPFSVRTWSITGPAAAALTWSTGKAGLSARVDVDRRSHGLTGTAKTINGPSPGGSSAAIRLARVPC